MTYPTLFIRFDILVFFINSSLMEFQVGYLALFGHFPSTHLWQTYLMLSLVFLSMLMKTLTTLSVTRLLISGNNYNSVQNILRIFWGKLRNQAKLDKTKDFDICFCIFFVSAIAKIYFCREDWTLGCPMQFWDFLNKIFLFSKMLSLKSFGNSWGIYKDFYTRYQVPFYLLCMKTVLTICKISKYYKQDCLKIFLLLSFL